MPCILLAILLSMAEMTQHKGVTFKAIDGLEGQVKNGKDCERGGGTQSI